MLVVGFVGCQFLVFLLNWFVVVFCFGCLMVCCFDCCLVVGLVDWLVGLQLGWSRAITLVVCWLGLLVFARCLFMRLEDYWYLVGFTFGCWIGWMLYVNLVVWHLLVSF